MKAYAITIFSLLFTCILIGQGNLNVTFDVALEGTSSSATTIHIYTGNEMVRTLTSTDGKIFNCVLEGGGLYTAEVANSQMTTKRVTFDLYQLTVSSELNTIHVPIGLKSTILTVGMPDIYSDFPITIYTYDSETKSMAENIDYANNMNTLAFEAIQRANMQLEEFTYEEE